MNECTCGDKIFCICKPVAIPDGCDLTTQCKMEVIRAALGIKSLEERDLLGRLENLYLAGIKKGLECAAYPPSIDDLVNRFLTWPLPDTVCADLCATRQGALHRSGTNLLSATEAKQMLEYLLRP